MVSNMQMHMYICAPEEGGGTCCWRVNRITCIPTPQMRRILWWSEASKLIAPIASAVGAEGGVNLPQQDVGLLPRDLRQ